MKEIKSPNTVIAKYISDTVDILRPKIEIKRPKEIIFYIGTNINGAPHLATALVHTIGFMFAQKTQEKFNIPCKVKIGIHDNISHESHVEPDGTVYHKTYHHALGAEKIKGFIKEYYQDHLQKLSAITGLAYELETYSQTQAQASFREALLETLKKQRAVGYCVSPSTGILQIRVPCPVCHFSDRDCKKTRYEFGSNGLAVNSTCFEHGGYQSTIRKDGVEPYIDLSTLYRNLVKEVMTVADHERMYVMIKGGDWAYSTPTIDLAFGAMGYNAVDVPARIFTPQIVTSTGAKLSKSLISLGDESIKDVPNWILDLNDFKTVFGDNYFNTLLDFAEELFRDPRNMYRTYTVDEIIRLFS